MSQLLAQLLTIPYIQRQAGRQAFERGSEYFLTRQAHILGMDDDHVQAYVNGSLSYIVNFTIPNGVFTWSCNCPIGERGTFCKHCVAAALVFRATAKADPPPPLESFRPLLEAEPSARLAALILEWAENDDALQQRIRHFAAQKQGPDAAKEAFEKAAIPPHHLSRRESAAFVENLSQAVELLAQNHPRQRIELTEFALQTLTRTYDMVHDDDRLAAVAQRLEALHLEACRQSHPDPLQLAERLFKLETNPAIYSFRRAAETYKDILGEEGLAAYKELAEAANAFDIQESVARASGKIEDLIAVLARDLSTPARFQLIIDACRQANARALAQTWARRAKKLFPA